jgi:SAM-dependent methyltransferase
VTSTTMSADGPGQGRPPGSYALGSGLAETDRLRQQRAVLRAHSAALLDRVGLRTGASAIDLGCGPAGILDLLSARAGPGGQVTGVDLDADYAPAARAFTRERGSSPSRPGSPALPRPRGG